jgi:hypothetical protein
MNPDPFNTHARTSRPVSTKNRRRDTPSTTDRRTLNPEIPPTSLLEVFLFDVLPALVLTVLAVDTIAGLIIHYLTK